MKNYKQFVKEANASADQAIKDSMQEPVPFLHDLGAWLLKDITLKRAWVVGLIICLIIMGLSGD